MVGAACATGLWVVLTCLTQPAHSRAATFVDSPLIKVHRSERCMGTLFQVTVFAANEAAGQSAAEQALKRAADLDAKLSDYKSDSELMRFCSRAGQGPMSVSDDLFRVLQKSQEYSHLGEGAFDITVGPVVRLWRLARRSRELPSEVERNAALQLVGSDKLVLDLSNRTARLTKPGMRLDLGGIAKGFAGDEMLRILQSAGCPRALVTAGGDVVAGDPPPGKSGWSVAIAKLADSDFPPMLTLTNAAVSTSGDAEQYVEIDGVRYSHIVNPKTGLGLTERLAATVIAPNGTAADALTKIVAVHGPERGFAILKRVPAVSARCARMVDRRLTVQETSDFSKYIEK